MKRRGTGRGTWILILTILVLALSVLLILRRERQEILDGSPWLDAENVQAELTGDPTEGDAPVDAGNTDREVAPAQETDGNAGGGVALQQNPESPAQQTQDAPAALTYTPETWKLVSDMVFTYRNRQEEGKAEIDALLAELLAADEKLGGLWRRIMEYWSWVNTDYEPSTGAVSSELPRDDSLCVVVLGFQLMSDGSMAPELIGRCETALRCLRAYPKAWLAVTGGGTASGNREATEADVMADWFIRNGIEPNRIIIENRSLTTEENAINTGRILAEGYPEIGTVLLVSSDYHVRLGALLLQTEAFLLAAEKGEGEAPYRVTANAAFPTAGNRAYSSVSMQAQDLWALTDPSY